MLQAIKNFLRRVFARLGFDLVRTGTVRYTFAVALKQLTDAGFAPRTVFARLT